MVEYINIKNFKSFKEFQCSFNQLNVIIGGNNSGKTSIFHAIQLFYFCFDKICNIKGSDYILSKTQTSALGAIPVIQIKDIFYEKKLRSGRHPTRIIISLKFYGFPSFEIEIYQAFSLNFMITGKNKIISKEHKEFIEQYRPVYIPSSTGVALKEDLVRPIAQENLIIQGRYGEIIRNLIFRLKQTDKLKLFEHHLKQLFNIKSFDIPFDEKNDLFLYSFFKENNSDLDILYSGSGFIQVSNILAFFLLYDRKLILIDEPDSHLHEELQISLYRLISDLTRTNDSQSIISTHSHILMSEAAPQDLILIEKGCSKPKLISTIFDGIDFLRDNGLTLPSNKIIEIFKNKKVLFIEGFEDDYKNFLKILGPIVENNFNIISKELVIIQSLGATNKWPFEFIKSLEKIMDIDIQYIYLADRDLHTDKQIEKLEKRAKKEKHKQFFLNRRNRECYLLDPEIIHLLLLEKINNNHIEQNWVKNQIIEEVNRERDEIKAEFQYY